MHIRESVLLGGKELSIETGKMAKQADGAIIIRYGDSVVLCTAVAAKSVREGLDFLPLTCEFTEKNYAGGKIPGGYFKREGRPTEAEILTSRLIDRPSRPLFPKGWRFDTQIIAMSLSFDKENPTDVLAMTAASAALHTSNIPWAGPFAGVRVGRIEGQFVVNPTFAQRDASDLDLVVAASRDAIVMVEGGADQVSEDVLVDALMFAHQAVQPVLDLIERIRAAVGKEKRVFVPPQKDEALLARVRELAGDRMRAAVTIREKHPRHDAESALHKSIVQELCQAEGAPYAGREKEVAEAISSFHKKVVRNIILDEQVYTRGAHRGWQTRALDSELHGLWLDEAQHSVHDLVEFAARMRRAGLRELPLAVGTRVAEQRGCDAPQVALDRLLLADARGSVPEPAHRLIEARKAERSAITLEVKLDVVGVVDLRGRDDALGAARRAQHLERIELEAIGTAQEEGPRATSIEVPGRQRTLDAEVHTRGLDGLTTTATDHAIALVA